MAHTGQMNKTITGWLWSAWNAVKPDVEAFLTAQFDKWMPKLIEAATVAMTHIGAGIANKALEAGARGATDVMDNVTEMVPGPIDDKLADVFLRPILDRLANRGIVPFAAVPPTSEGPDA
jgi:hypothetical protein